MRLCSICDKEISGKWCKNCHRFVKSYEIGKGVHFNKSHDLSDDAGCTYHTNDAESNATNNTVFETRQTYNRSTVTNESGKPVVKKKSKVLIIIIAFYVIFMAINVIVSVFSGAVQSFTEEIPEKFFDELSLSEKEEQEENFEYPLSPNLEEKLEALEAFVVEKTYKGDGYSFYYYNPEDIATLDFPCDERHFDFSVSDFEAWLTEEWPDAYESQYRSDYFMNYFYDKEEYSLVSFSSEQKFFGTDGFSVRVEYDTVTEHVHWIEISSSSEQKCTDWSYSLLQQVDANEEWTEALFQTNMKEGFALESYYTVYGTNRLTIQCYKSDDTYSVHFFPGYGE